MRVERDDKVRLTPVWFVCVKPSMPGTALLLGGYVFESLRQPGAALCTSIISCVLLTYSIYRDTPRGFIEHVIQQANSNNHHRGNSPTGPRHTRLRISRLHETRPPPCQSPYGTQTHGIPRDPETAGIPVRDPRTRDCTFPTIWDPTTTAAIPVRDTGARGCAFPECMGPDHHGGVFRAGPRCTGLHGLRLRGTPTPAVVPARDPGERD